MDFGQRSVILNNMHIGVLSRYKMAEKTSFSGLRIPRPGSYQERHRIACYDRTKSIQINQIGI